MAKKRRQFSDEYKREAVRLAQESDQSVAAVARELGIARSMLHQWMRQFAESDATGAPGTAADVRRLQRELERVRQERDFLKKAAAFFARESP